MMLKSEGYSCELAMSGKSAIDIILNRFDLIYGGLAQMFKLILLDFSMPGMDGPEVARQIRSLCENNLVLTEAEQPFICCCSAYD